MERVLTWETEGQLKRLIVGNSLLIRCVHPTVWHSSLIVATENQDEPSSQWDRGQTNYSGDKPGWPPDSPWPPAPPGSLFLSSKLTIHLPYLRLENIWEHFESAVSFLIPATSEKSKWLMSWNVSNCLAPLTDEQKVSHLNTDLGPLLWEGQTQWSTWHRAENCWPSRFILLGLSMLLSLLCLVTGSQAMSGPARQQSVSLGPFTLYKNRQGGLGTGTEAPRAGDESWQLWRVTCGAELGK